MPKSDSHIFFRRYYDMCTALMMRKSYIEYNLCSSTKIMENACRSGRFSFTNYNGNYEGNGAMNLRQRGKLTLSLGDQWHRPLLPTWPLWH